MFDKRGRRKFTSSCEVMESTKFRSYSSRDHKQILNIFCPHCLLSHDIVWISQIDNQKDFIIKCKRCHIRFGLDEARRFSNRNEISNAEELDDGFNINTLILNNINLLVGCFLCVLVILITMFIYKKNSEQNIEQIVTNLSLKYPAQKKETWHHISSVLDTKNPAVKTIILLYGKDKTTSGCLQKELLSFYTKSNLKKEDALFKWDPSIEDYGQILEDYLKKVKEHKLLIVDDINLIPANIAKVFHVLCDEITPTVKPSLYIFTLKYKENTQNLKPISIATNILKEAWSDLPGKDLHPLLSRIVKNVVDILPESEIKC